MKQIELIEQHLTEADGVADVLAAGWEIFELIGVLAADSAEQAADLYPAFMFARGAAAGGRNAIALAPSMPAGESHRRIRLGNDDLHDPPPADTAPFMNSRTSAGQAGPVEQAMMDRRVSDPVILLRAAAIDNAARRLIIQAESTAPEPDGQATSPVTFRHRATMSGVLALGPPALPPFRLRIIRANSLRIAGKRQIGQKSYMR